MPTPAVAASQLLLWLRTEFANTYRIAYDAMKARLGSVMELDIPSSARTEYYGYWQTAPYPVRWKAGEEIPEKAFKSITFNVTNYKWGRRVSWQREDRADDQTRSLLDQARSAGDHWATLPERVFFQLLGATVDTELLPAVPNAPDGAAFFATTAGGAARFGATSGNLLTGTGVATPEAIRTDFYDAIEQFRLFQDTEGQPLWDDSVHDKGYTIIYGAGNESVFRRAFEQRFSPQAAAGTAQGTQTNIILDAGLKVKLWSTPRIADNDWFVFLDGAPKKSCFWQTRDPLEEKFATADNSDSVRGTDIEYIQWRSRGSAGIALPYQAIKVNN